MMTRRCCVEFAYKFDSVSWRGHKMPDAVFTTWVELGPTWAADLSDWQRDLVLASTFFAVVVVLVEGEAIETGTLVAPHHIVTDVLAASIIHSTLVTI